MGLGALGGGIATTKWLVKRGAKVTVTDKRSRKELKNSVKKLGTAAKRVKFVLGEHREIDFKSNDVIVVNPAVPRESWYLAVAKKHKKLLVNDARIFFDLVKNPIIAVTGTRGKTTTAGWIAHFLRAKDKNVFAAGNTPERPLLADIERLGRRPETPAILELSSWQLELLPGAKRMPDVAVITNVYPDHLNRYDSIKSYALAKANIFMRQKRNQKLVLNAGNPRTDFFLKLKPSSGVFFFSKEPLPGNQNGIFLKNSAVYFKDGGQAEKVISERIIGEFMFRGEHNLENLLAALLASHLFGADWAILAKRIATLPDILFRQQVIMERRNWKIVNDSASTSPDAAIAAVERFVRQGETTLITGGTDKNLDFSGLARTLKKHLKPERVFFLNGSATRKLIGALRRTGYFGRERPQVFEDLTEILVLIKASVGKSRVASRKRILIFSPGAASFEKFRNEFDRGEKFNLYSKKIFGR